MAIASRCGLPLLRFISDIQINITDKVVRRLSLAFTTEDTEEHRGKPRGEWIGWSLRSLCNRLRNQLEKIFGYAICRVPSYRSFVQIIPEHRAHT